MSSLNLINEKPNFSSIKGLIEIINWDTGLLWKQTHGKPSIIIDIYIDHTYNSSVTVAKQTQEEENCPGCQHFPLESMDRLTVSNMIGLKKRW